MWWTGALFAHRLVDPSTGLAPAGEVRAAGWTTAGAVLDELGRPPLEEADERHLDVAVASANAAVARLRPDLRIPAFAFAADLSVVDPVVRLGTTTLAQRWFVRRTGSDAVMTGDFGTLALPAIDHDLQQLLQVGRNFPPRVA